MTTGSTGSLIIPKWQLAVIIGAPLAIGLGYLLYRTKYSDDDELTSSDGTITNRKKVLKDKTISLDDDDGGGGNEKLLSIDGKKIRNTDNKLTPLELATEYKNDGNGFFRKGKYDEAIECYDRAIETCPIEQQTDLSTFYQNRAAAYEQLRKWSAVKEDCTKALAINMRYLKALNRRARALEHLDDLTASLEDITMVCILEGFNNNSSLTFADRILKKTGRADAIHAKKTFKQVYPSKGYIRTYYQSFTNDPMHTISLPADDEQNVSDADDHKPPKGFVRAKRAFDAENFTEIIAACTEEIENCQSNGKYRNEAILLRGTFYFLTGLYQLGFDDFNYLIDPDTKKLSSEAAANNNRDVEVSVAIKVNALIKRANYYILNEQWETGLIDLRLAEELDPTNDDIYYARGQEYVIMDRIDDAIREFDRALKLKPNHAQRYILKCYAEYRAAVMTQDEFGLRQCMTHFADAIDKYPDCGECYSVMGQVLADQGQFEQANSFYLKATGLLKDNASLYVHRGLMQLQWDGDITKACELLHKAIEIDDKSGLAYETLATVEVQCGNLSKAVVLFEKAISLAKYEAEMSHLYALRNASVAQINVGKRLGIDITNVTQLRQTVI